jgi:hypothetical protein
MVVALAGIRMLSNALVGVSPPSPVLWAAAVALVGTLCAMAHLSKRGRQEIRAHRFVRKHFDESPDLSIDPGNRNAGIL